MKIIPRKASTLLAGTLLLLKNKQIVLLVDDVKGRRVVGVKPYHLSGTVLRQPVPISPSFIDAVYVKGGRNIEVIDDL